MHDANNRLASALLELQLLQGRLEGPEKERAREIVQLLVDAIDQFDGARRALSPEADGKRIGEPVEETTTTTAPDAPATGTARDITALVVDDEEPILHILREILVSCGITHVDTAATPAEAIELFERVGHDLVFTDAMLGIHGNGTDLARRFRGSRQGTVIVLMSGWDQEESEIGLFDHCLSKPFQLREVSDIVVGLQNAP